MPPTAPYQYAETLLKVEGVSLALKGLPVLRDLNMELRNITREDQVTGQVVGLLGPSGVGKTSLFRILAGLSAPDAGRILLGAEGRPVERGSVGVVSQHYPLFRHRTVMGNLLVAGRRAGLTRGDCLERAHGYLQRFGLEEHRDKYPSELSGGQRQRVAIAQQFICSEHFLLMDEPFTGLDPLAVEEVCGLITEVAGLHDLNTIIVVTHDISAALEVADTIWLLGRDRDDSGRVVPGARLQASINLIDRGLTWRKHISSTPEFAATLREIREMFSTL